MAEQIRQSLGFDAGGAIKGIDDLVRAFGRLNKALADTSANFKRFNQGKVTKEMRNMASAAGRAAVATRELANQSRRLDTANKRVQNLNNSSKSLLLSWQTLGRIAIAQGIVRGLNLINTQFQEAVGRARDFGLALAEAAAIAPGGIDNFQSTVANLNDTLIQTSNAFGFDVLDLAEAKYQEFSNQVKGSADSQRFFINANKLARISASEVGEAVGALSSVLNSYDQSAENSDRVTAALFKTIELGRLRLSEIADQLGNVTPLARGAGIGFEELGGALTTITRAGVSPSRALTQIRALINQLTKPTKELQTLFTQTFRVQNIEEAIARFGSLEGVIQAIGEASGGSSTRIAQLFTNIRARNAFESLNNQLELFAENTEKITDAANEGATFIDRLLEKFNEQDAVKFQQALTRLKNEFLELAQDALPAITSALNFAATAIGSLGETVTNFAVGTLGIWSARLLLAGESAKLFGSTTLAAKAGPLGLAFAVGFAVGELLEWIDTSRVAARTATELQAIDAIKADNIKQINQDASDTIKELENLKRQGNETFAALDQAAAGSLDAIRAANDTFVSSIGTALDDLISVQERRVKELEDIINQAESRRTKNADEQASIRQKIADREFEAQLRGRDELSQAFLKQQRAEEALRKARGPGGFGFGQETADLDQRIKDLERAEKLAQEAVSSARATGNRAQIFRAESTLNDILRQQLETKKQQQALDDQQVAAAKAKKAEEQKRLDDLKENVKTLKDNLSLFSDGGALLSPEERDNAVKNAQEAFSKIQDLALDRDDLSVDKLLGITDLSLRFNEQLSKINIDAPRDKLTSALEQAAEGQIVSIPVQFIVDQAALAGITANIDPLDPLSGIQDIRNQAIDRLVENEQVQQRINTASQDEIALKEKVRALVQDIVDLNQQNARAEQAPRRAENILQRTEQVRQAFENLLGQDGAISSDQISQIDQLLRSFDDVLAGTDLPGLPFLGEEAAIDNIIEKLQELRKAQIEAAPQRGELNRTLGEESQLQGVLQTIDEALEKQSQLALKPVEMGQNIDDATGKLGTLSGAADNSAQSASGIVGQYASLNDQLTRAISQQRELNAAQAQSPGPGGGAQPRMFGGVLYRAGGGFVPRGTDRIPAMLSPGEFVVRASAARRFASQLNAMNAGVTPVYRQEGGPVINNSVNVGDINVNGTSDPDATARRVMAQIRREFRRGTSNLR